MPWHHAVVVIGRGDQGGRVVRARLDVVQRRVGEQRRKLFGVVRRAVVADPGPADREFVEPQHVEHADAGERGAEQVGTLRQACADQQTAVGATADGQLFARGVTVVDEVFGRGNKIVKDVLLVELGSCFVPFAAILAAAPEVGHGKDAPQFHPY